MLCVDQTCEHVPFHHVSLVRSLRMCSAHCLGCYLTPALLRTPQHYNTVCCTPHPGRLFNPLQGLHKHKTQAQAQALLHVDRSAIIAPRRQRGRAQTPILDLSHVCLFVGAPTGVNTGPALSLPC